MTDPYLSVFVAAGLNHSGTDASSPCDRAPGACLGLNDDEAPSNPDFVVETIGDITPEQEIETGASAAGFDSGCFEVTEEGEEELERRDNRVQVEHLGKIIDNMVHIVGMYTALLQDKVEG
jgi:hypothetical protein